MQNTELLQIRPVKRTTEGCVTASARSFLPILGIDFESRFLPELSTYRLDDNAENNHMLGVAVVAANEGLPVSVHTHKPIASYLVLDGATAKVQEVHKKAINEILKLSKIGKLKLIDGSFNVNSLTESICEAISKGQYILVILDWKRWEVGNEDKVGNHIVLIHGIEENKISVVDTALEPQENPVKVTPEQLFSSLTEAQQLVYIGGIKND